MRRISFLVMALCLLFAVGVVFADDYTVAVCSFTPTASAHEFTKGAFPNIVAGAKIDKIILSNGGATAQVITFYDTCTSSMTATVSMTIDLPAAIGITTIDLPAHNPLVQTNLGIKKSAAGSAVNANIIYR